MHRLKKESRKNKPAFLIYFSNEKSLKKNIFFLDKLILLCYNDFVNVEKIKSVPKKHILKEKKMKYLNLKKLNREIDAKGIENSAGIEIIDAYVENGKLKFSFRDEDSLIIADYDSRKIEKAEIYGSTFDAFAGYGQIFEDDFAKIIRIVNEIAKDSKKEVIKEMFKNAKEENDVLVIDFEGGKVKLKDDKTYLFFGNNGEITVDDFAKASEKRKEIEEILSNIVEIAK